MAKTSDVITILGAGYVGLTTAAILSNCGFKVFIVEPNPKRLKVIRQGKSFFYEKGLDALIAKGIENKYLIPTDSYKESVSKSSFVFSCVGTPDNPDGSSNLSYVFSAAYEAIDFMQSGAIYIQKSTVPVGTGKKIEALIKQSGRKIYYVSNPEFLKEGTALADSLYFDRVVVGSNNNESVNKVIGIYKVSEDKRNEIAEIVGIESRNEDGKYIQTGLDSAELIKVTSNAFLALKISFANSIAMFADHTGADVNEVMDAVGADKRIGKAFLNAGRGYGGGCFPKDVSGLINSAAEHGVDLSIMTAASLVNESMPEYIALKTQEKLNGFKGKKIAVLGLAFKAGTSDARKSPGVKIANFINNNGAAVSIYDPQAMEEVKEDLNPEIATCKSIEEAANESDAVIISTDWPEFKNYNLHKLSKIMNGNILVDAMNIFEINAVNDADLIYIGVGRS
jgi:UDPglucose 6-dehydrogenase